jgi:hypothetical protein
MSFLYGSPGFSLHSNPGLKLANAFGVFKLNHYLSVFPLDIPQERLLELLYTTHRSRDD